MRLYRCLHAVATWLFPRLMRLHCRGLEYIPVEGPFIIAANHFNALDPVMLAITVQRPIHFMAKTELIQTPILGGLLRRLGVFPVKRGHIDVAAVRQALRVLDEGKILGIFPEGTRSNTGELQEAFAGVAMFAARADVPIVPVALYGEYRLGAVFRLTSVNRLE